MKVCFKCFRVLHPSEFYVHPRMADGHLGKCKDCTKRDVMEHRNKNLDRLRAYDRARGKLPHRKALMIRVRRLQWEKNPIPEIARRKFYGAVRSGKIRRLPCEICGACRSVGHHPDYSRPFDVRWLCYVHHEAVHHGKITLPEK